MLYFEYAVFSAAISRPSPPFYAVGLVVVDRVRRGRSSRVDLTGTMSFYLSACRARACLYFGGRTVIFINFAFRLGSCVVL